VKPEDSSASASNQKQAQGHVSLLCFGFGFLTLSSFVSRQCQCLDYIESKHFIEICLSI